MHLHLAPRMLYERVLDREQVQAINFHASSLHAPGNCGSGACAACHLFIAGGRQDVGCQGGLHQSSMQMLQAGLCMPSELEAADVLWYWADSRAQQHPPSCLITSCAVKDGLAYQSQDAAVAAW